MVARILIFIHRAYKACLSPFFGNACRFEPSCSNYALEAMLKHGLLSGTFLTVKRLFRCHPFCSGGLDPVPEPKNLLKKEREVKSPQNICSK